MSDLISSKSQVSRVSLVLPSHPQPDPSGPGDTANSEVVSDWLTAPPEPVKERANVKCCGTGCTHHARECFPVPDIHIEPKVPDHFPPGPSHVEKIQNSTLIQPNQNGLVDKTRRIHRRGRPPGPPHNSHLTTATNTSYIVGDGIHPPGALKP